MISVDQALPLVKKAKRSFGSSFLSLEEILDKNLAQVIFTYRDYPSFDRVSMDSIVIVFNANIPYDHIHFSEGINGSGNFISLLRANAIKNFFSSGNIMTLHIFEIGSNGK